MKLSNETILDWFDSVGIHTEVRHTNKSKQESYARTIKSYKSKCRDSSVEEWNTRKAFNLCGLYTTDTEYEALANYRIKILEMENEIKRMESFKKYFIERVRELSTPEKMLQDLMLTELNK